MESLARSCNGSVEFTYLLSCPPFLSFCSLPSPPLDSLHFASGLASGVGWVSPPGVPRFPEATAEAATECSVLCSLQSAFLSTVSSRQAKELNPFLIQQREQNSFLKIKHLKVDSAEK